MQLGIKKNEEVVELEEVKGMTYIELVNKELNDKLNPLLKKEKEMEKAMIVLHEEIKNDGKEKENVPVIIKLREKLEKIKKEINEVRISNQIDLQLSCIANGIDSSERNNKGIDLIMEAGGKLNELIRMLPEIEKCYGNEYYAPTAYSSLKHGAYGLASQLNVEIPKLKRSDKNELIKQFNKRYKELQEEKKRIEESEARIKIYDI